MVPMKIAVLMTCHNRKEMTVRCLRRLLSQLGSEDRIFLVDDGSTDGTGEEVERMFECSNVRNGRVIRGDGTLYWAKGMALAWRTALESETNHQSPTTSHQSPFSHFLWLNDDVMLKPDAIVGLLADWEACDDTRSVIVGTCSADEREMACTYGPTDARNQLMPPGGGLQCVQGWFAGNCVLIPREAYEVVGIISDEYTHARADYDYAERLKRAGIPFFCAARYVGTCVRDDAAKMKGKNLWQRIRLLWSPGYCNLHDLWLIRSRYHGRVRAMVSCVHMVGELVIGGW